MKNKRTIKYEIEVTCNTQGQEKFIEDMLFKIVEGTKRFYAGSAWHAKCTTQIIRK